MIEPVRPITALCCLHVFRGYREAAPGCYGLNSQDMISFMIATGSLNSQDMIKILKQSGHDFLGKCLCDGYCAKIICDVCVWRMIWFCEKASLRICYVILFEYKGPWMLKSGSLIFNGNIKISHTTNLVVLCRKKMTNK